MNRGLEKQKMFKRNKKNKRGALSSAMVSVIIITILFLILVLVFFGDGLLEEGFRAIRDMVNEVPDVESNTGFFKNQENQLLFLKGYQETMQNAQKETLVSKGCLAELPSLEVDGFYNDGYNLYIEQMPENKVSLRLTRSAKQDYEDDSAATHVPVATLNVENVQLCIIASASADEFYKQLNDVQAGDVPDLSNIVPIKVNKLLISSVREGGDEREIGYKVSADDDKYVWAKYFKKGTKTQPYLFRLDYLGQTYMCFFPTVNGVGLTSKCGEPNGYMQLDCLDSDNGARSIPTNLANGLIPVQYQCGNKAITDKECLCGGTYEPNSKTCDASSIFSKEQCDCANKLARNNVANSNFVFASGRCMYFPASCTALLKEKADFLITKRADECS